MVAVRLATVEDLPAVLAITNWYALHSPANFAQEPEPLAMWREDWEAHHAKCPWFVATEDATSSSKTNGGAIVGFAKASPYRGRCAYAWSVEVSVYLKPDRHRQGLGRLLYGNLIPTLQRQNYRTALAGITIPNPASVGLHERFGFRRVAVFERAGWKFGKWHDVGFWRLDLAPDDPASPPRPIRLVSEACAPNRRPASPASSPSAA